MNPDIPITYAQFMFGLAALSWVAANVRMLLSRSVVADDPPTTRLLRSGTLLALLSIAASQQGL